MKKNRTILKVFLVLVLIGLSAAAMFIFQEGRYAEIVNEKNKVTEEIKIELNDLQNQSKRSVIVFNKDMEQGSIITNEDLLTLQLKESITPGETIVDKNEIIGKRVKIDVSLNQYITSNLIYGEEEISDDLREREYGFLNVPEKLTTGDTVDLMIKFPSGQIYVVLSKKLITDIAREYDASNKLIKEVVWINQGEEETIRMGSAIVDAYLYGAELYLLEYVDPYIQSPAAITYPRNFPVMEMIDSNPNLIAIAEQELINREALEDSISYVIDNKVNFTTPDIEGTVPNNNEGSDNIVDTPVSDNSQNNTTTEQVNDTDTSNTTEGNADTGAFD